MASQISVSSESERSNQSAFSASEDVTCEQLQESPVWDLSTRCFHWILVCLVILSWASADYGLIELHRWSGASLLALLIFRVCWGIIGSTTARFRHFMVGPSGVLSYWRSSMRGGSAAYIGHTPAGGWAVIAMLAALTLQVLTGLFANDDIRFLGPLAEWVSKETSDQLTRLHAMTFNVILVLVWVHVVAIGFYLFVKGEDLVTPMLTGKKEYPRGQPPKVRFAKRGIAALVWILSAGVAFLIAR